MEQVNALVMADDHSGFIADLTSSTNAFCSITPKTEEESIQLFNITNNPENKLKDFINMPLRIKDVYVDEVTLTQETTGEIQKCPRIILIDENGKGYQCVSSGVFSALKRLFMMFGMPTWEKPITIVPKLISKSANKNILTIEVQADKKGK